MLLYLIQDDDKTPIIIYITLFAPDGQTLVPPRKRGIFITGEREFRCVARKLFNYFEIISRSLAKLSVIAIRDCHATIVEWEKSEATKFQFRQSRASRSQAHSLQIEARLKQCRPRIFLPAIPLLDSQRRAVRTPRRSCFFIDSLEARGLPSTLTSPQNPTTDCVAPRPTN